MKEVAIIVSSKSRGHYQSYSELFTVMLEQRSKVVYKIKAKEFIFADRFIVVDGDGKQLFLVVAAFIRNIMARKTYFFSVRTESFLSKGFYGFVKRMLASIVKVQKHTHLISIHRGSCDLQDRIPTIDYIYDPQLWDLKLLTKSMARPSEDVGLKDVDYYCAGNKRIFLILGALNPKRSADELLESLREISRWYKVVFAGAIADNYLAGLKNHDVFVINRYISDEEMLYLYNKADVVYAYYSLDVNRPSGIFGRAVQLGKFVLIRKGGFLDCHYGNYQFALKVACLDPIEIERQYERCINMDKKNVHQRISFDDSGLLRKYLNN